MDPDFGEEETCSRDLRKWVARRDGQEGHLRLGRRKIEIEIGGHGAGRYYLMGEEWFIRSDRLSRI